jgi:hypothetical protein
MTLADEGGLALLIVYGWQFIGLDAKCRRAPEIMTTYLYVYNQGA